MPNHTRFLLEWDFPSASTTGLVSGGCDSDVDDDDDGKGDKAGGEVMMVVLKGFPLLLHCTHKCVTIIFMQQFFEFGIVYICSSIMTILFSF